MAAAQAEIEQLKDKYLRSVAEMALLIVCGMVALLAFTAWTRGMRLLWWLVLLVAALAQYYMLTYSVVMDPGMAANVLQTDAREAADLLSPRLLGALLAVMVLPTWWLVRVRIPPMRPLRQLGRNLALLALALAVAAGMVALNARHLAPASLPDVCEFGCADVSFISLEKILPALRSLLRTGADAVTLIKPQFEAGRTQVGSGGVVRDPAVHRAVIDRIRAFGEREARLAWRDHCESPLRGPAGNIEFLAWWTAR